MGSWKDDLFSKAAHDVGKVRVCTVLCRTLHRSVSLLMHWICHLKVSLFVALPDDLALVVSKIRKKL